MLLVIVVGLVAIELQLIQGIVLHSSAGVVGSTVNALIILRGIVPSVVGSFLSVERNELHGRAFSEVSRL